VDRIADQFLNRDALVASATLLGLGLGQTGRLVAAVLLVAIVLGLGVAWARTRASAWARALAVAYVDLARTTPPLVSLVVVCYGLPLLGLPALDTFAAAVVALGLLHAAHVGEIYRGGALAVGRGQREAARALALSDLQALRWVLLPQAIRAIIPPLTSQATQVVRDSPLALMIGYPELLSRAREAQALTANSTAIAAAGVVYLGLLLALQASAAAMARAWRRRTGTAPRIGPR
jgi:polar amino acid transport system permease protein